MDLMKIQSDLLEYVKDSYPQMKIRVEAWRNDPTRIAIFFVEPKFSLLYPLQRYHYLTHLVPAEYQERNLSNSVWFEMAPGENPEDLRYPDDDLIADITPDVMLCLTKSGVFDALDETLYPSKKDSPSQQCYGDFRTTRSILLSRGFTEDELFEVFHVLMAKGGFCDCEILYNVSEGSRLAADYWRARAENRNPFDPHKGA